MSTQEQTIPDHPATFSKAIMRVLHELTISEADRVGHELAVLDPFAGVGTIHELPAGDERISTFGIEIQPEWAAAHPQTTCANMLDFARSWESEPFDMIVTSPCYGNRMSDHHNAQDKCRACDGVGHLGPATGAAQSDYGRACSKCKGSGLTLRNTYKHALDRSGVQLVEHDDNAAVMQWGARYRSFHEQAWRACDSVLRPGGLTLLNVKNHVRGDRVQQVSEFHVNCWLRLGYTLERAEPITTRGLAFGENSDVRTSFELIVALRKPS